MDRLIDISEGVMFETNRSIKIENRYLLDAVKGLEDKKVFWLRTLIIFLLQTHIKV